MRYDGDGHALCPFPGCDMRVAIDGTPCVLHAETVVVQVFMRSTGKWEDFSRTSASNAIVFISGADRRNAATTTIRPDQRYRGVDWITRQVVIDEEGNPL